MRSYREALPAAEEAWAKETDIAEVWRGRQWISLDMHADELVVLQALQQPLPTEFLGLCERLRIPPLMESVLRWPSIAMDFDCILELLAAAPPIANPGEPGWNHRMTAPLLMQLALEHVNDLGRPQLREEALAPAAEVAALVERVVATSLARIDGLLLTTSWARHFIWMGRSQGADAHFENVFNAMLAAMARGGVTPGAVGSIAVARRPGADSPGGTDLVVQKEGEADEEARVELFMLAVLIHTEVANAGASSNEVDLREGFRALLLEKSGWLEDYQGNQVPNWRHYAVARLYVGLFDPVGAWQSDWEALAAQRRQAVHWSYAEDRLAAVPSLFLSRVGIALMEWSFDVPNQKAGQALAIWHRLFDAALPFATHWSLAEDSWRSVVTALFARFSNAKAASGNAVEAGEVLALLEALGGDDELLTIAASNLVSNGVPLQLIRSSGEALIGRIQSFIEWDDAAPGAGSLPPRVLAFWVGQLENHG